MLYLSRNFLEDLTLLAMRMVTTVTTTFSKDAISGLISGALMPLVKPTGGLRPIVLIDIVVRAVLRALITCEGSEVQKYFSSHGQFGLSCAKTPVIKAMSMLGKLHSQNIAAVTVSLDAENAHNCIYQSAVLDSLSEMVEESPSLAVVASAAARTICLGGSLRLPIRSLKSSASDI
jgi:hypothetical protein